MKAATASTPKRKGTGMPQPDPDLPHGTSLEPSHNSMPHSPRDPNVLSYSSNEKIAVLARNIDMMEDELRSNGSNGLVWPQNVTYRNYFEYMFFPTLVYQLEYPRTDTYAISPMISAAADQSGDDLWWFWRRLPLLLERSP